MFRRWIAVSSLSALCLAGCRQDVHKQPAAAVAAHKLGIRPYGDETVKIDTSSLPDAEKKAFQYIDEHIDEHVENLQKWIQQPSISNSGEGIPESAEMVKGFFDKLGCQETRVFEWQAACESHHRGGRR